MDEKLKELFKMDFVEARRELYTLTLIFKKKDSEEMMQLSIRESGGPGADSNWYNYPAVYLDDKEIWHG